MIVLVTVLCVIVVAAVGALVNVLVRLARQVRMTADAERRAAEAAAPAEVEAPAEEPQSAPVDTPEPASIVEPASNVVEPASNVVEPASNVVEPASIVVEPASIVVEAAIGALPTEPRPVDAAALWAMERARSERTWRYSVSLGPDSVSVFELSDDPLLAALQIEVDAAREEVGTVVHLDADVPHGLSDEASLLTLRVAQELLAPVVRQGEQATLHLHADGPDLVITMTAVDEDDSPIEVAPFLFAGSDSIEAVPGGARILGIVPATETAAESATETATDSPTEPVNQTGEHPAGSAQE